MQMSIDFNKYYGGNYCVIGVIVETTLSSITETETRWAR